MAAKLNRIKLVAIALLLTACSAPWSSSSPVTVVPQATQPFGALARPLQSQALFQQ